MNQQPVVIPEQNLYVIDARNTVIQPCVGRGGLYLAVHHDTVDHQYPTATNVLVYRQHDGTYSMRSTSTIPQDQMFIFRVEDAVRDECLVTQPLPYLIRHQYPYTLCRDSQDNLYWLTGSFFGDR